MNNLSNKIKVYLGRTPDFLEEVKLQDDGQGAYIKHWGATDKVKPTDAQLDALSSQATTLESNNQVIQTRINLYGTTAEQLEYIVENGVEAFIEKQQQIKTDNPKE